MSLPIILLRPPDRADRGILRRAHRTLYRLDRLAVTDVKAPLVERVLAHEVDGRLVESVAAGGAARGVEGQRFVGEDVEVGEFEGGVGAEGSGCATVLMGCV